MFTYTGDPSVSNRDKIRFLIGDTVEANAHFQDEEISWLLMEWGDVYVAAIAGCEILSGRYAAKAQTSKSVGDLSISETFTSASAEFRTLADRIASMRSRLNPPKLVANPNTLGAGFRVGIHDNGRG